MKNKVAIIVTNQSNYPEHNIPTGLWLSELVHFWNIMEDAGFSFDLISPKGGVSPLEPKSLTFPMIDKATKARYNEVRFMERLDNTLAVKDIEAKDYDVIYFTGGHGVMFDFIDDEQLQRLTREIYEQGGVVSSVCHGYCGLLNTKLTDGRYLISGKSISGFSWVEEILAGVKNKVPYNAEDIAKKHGAIYRKSKIPFKGYVEIDDRLVTGQNPNSAHKTALATIKVLSQI